jgi:hypothetical protein
MTVAERFVALVCVSLVACGAPEATPAATQKAPPASRVARTAQAASSGHQYLVEQGDGSEAQALAYYRAALDGRDPTTYTRDDFVQEHMLGRTLVHGYYRNASELGFWRQMTCTSPVGRGEGGCMVTNFTREEGPLFGDFDVGTVTMTLGVEGAVRFFVFTPDGKLTPAAVLDSEGAKFVPNVCVVCHGGAPQDDPSAVDLGASFREFEPSLLQRRSDVLEPQAEEEWYALNQAVRGANVLLRKESEGAPGGADAAHEAVIAHIDATYAGLGAPASHAAPPFSHDARDLAYLPGSWAAQDDSSVRLFSAVVNRYCMGCHRVSDLDWSNFATFAFLRGKNDGVGLLQAYVQAANHAAGVPRMPQSEVGFGLMAGDADAQAAIADWLATR